MRWTRVAPIQGRVGLRSKNKNPFQGYRIIFRILGSFCRCFCRSFCQRHYRQKLVPLKVSFVPLPGVLPVPFLGYPVMRGVIPGLTGQIAHILCGLFRADLRQLSFPLVVTVKACPADPAEPFFLILGIVRDHHAGMQARAPGQKITHHNIPYASGSEPSSIPR